MAGQRNRAARWLCGCALAAVALASAAQLRPSAFSDARAPQKKDLFDQIYERGQPIETTLKTLTATFAETSTSSLLTRPLQARGTVAVERPSRIVLQYREPDTRTVLIDGDVLFVRLGDTDNHAVFRGMITFTFY